jgi:hypothetical protein
MEAWNFRNKREDSWKEINGLHYREKRRRKQVQGKHGRIFMYIIRSRGIKNKVHLILILDMLRFRIVAVKMALNI